MHGLCKKTLASLVSELFHCHYGRTWCVSSHLHWFAGRLSVNFIHACLISNAHVTTFLWQIGVQKFSAWLSKNRTWWWFELKVLRMHGFSSWFLDWKLLYQWTDRPRACVRMLSDAHHASELPLLLTGDEWKTPCQKYVGAVRQTEVKCKCHSFQGSISQGHTIFVPLAQLIISSAKGFFSLYALG
jgi:hypothetical protein